MQAQTPQISRSLNPASGRLRTQAGVAGQAAPVLVALVLVLVLVLALVLVLVLVLALALAIGCGSMRRFGTTTLRLVDEAPAAVPALYRRLYPPLCPWRLWLSPHKPSSTSPTIQPTRMRKGYAWCAWTSVPRR